MNRKISGEIRAARDVLERRRPDVVARKRAADKIRTRAKERALASEVRAARPRVPLVPRKAKNSKRKTRKTSQDLMDRGRRLPGSFENGKHR